MTMLRTFVLRTDGNAKALWGFLKSNWASCAQQGKPLAVTVTEHKSKRTGQANRRYWAILTQIAESAWSGGRRYTKEQWHHYYAGEFIGWEELPGGRMVPISTTTLDVSAFSEYADRIVAHATTELGVEL